MAPVIPNYQNFGYRYMLNASDYTNTWKDVHARIPMVMGTGHKGAIYCSAASLLNTSGMNP